MLLQRRGAIVNVTADESALQSVQPNIQAFLDSLPASAASDADWQQRLTALNEAITVPTQVGFLQLISASPKFPLQVLNRRISKQMEHSRGDSAKLHALRRSIT